MFGRSPSTDKLQKRVYRARRRHRDHAFEPPFHKRLFRRIEEWNKRMTISAVGWLISPRKVSAPLDPLKLKKILFIRNDAIGDMAVSTACWRFLKNKYPHLVIGVIGSFRNLPVVAHDPDIDFRYECNTSTLKDVFMAVRKTREQEWDLVIPLIYNKKTRMAVLSKIFAPHAAASIVLFPNDPVWRYKKLFSIIVQSDFEPSRDIVMDLMRSHFEGTFGLNIPQSEWNISLYPDEDAIHNIRLQIQEQLREDKTKAYFHLNLEAKTAHKEFGFDNSLELSKFLVKMYPDHSVIWTISPNGISKAEEFLTNAAVRKIHVQPTQNIHELIGIVRGASVVISPDTSVIHFASAEKRPLVGLYPYHHEWRPFKIPNIVLHPIRGEPVSTIPVRDVLNAVDQLMIDRISGNN
jgi:ADP-heptose:LPS heptosyltransferase